MARGAASATAAAAQNYTETTIDIIRYLVLYIYLAGLILPIPIGWLGEGIGHWSGAPYWSHLGYIPGAVAFVAVGFFWWSFEARVLAAEVSIQALPEWLKQRAIKWSTGDHFTYKFFFGSSMVGLWMPILLWVPAEFPVWQHPAHYVGMLAVAMAVTQFVATAEPNAKVWRNRYGVLLGLFALRHVAGFAGFNVEDLYKLTGLGVSFDFSDEASMIRLLMILAVGMGIVVYLLNSQKTKTASTH
ncbi:MAG: hypothetical protein ABI643_03560 [Candidatus Doudnabacteria bacterium]